MRASFGKTDEDTNELSERQHEPNAYIMHIDADKGKSVCFKVNHHR